MTSLPVKSMTGTEAGASPRSDSQESGRVPCLHSDISIQPPEPGTIITAQHRRSAHILSLSVFALSKKYSLENLGFLTLTFKDHVTDPAEAQKRLNSLLSNVIKKRYRDYIGVLERQKSGRIHYHLLIALDRDIRTGCDFQAFTRQDYTSAPATLRQEWSYWRKTAPLYRFGRTELLPIKTTSTAIAFYVGKYIGKHIEQRQDCDKGVRLVRYSRGARVGTTRFQFVSPGSALWRAKLAKFADMVGEWFGVHVEGLDQLKAHLGPRWAYHWREFIMGLDVEGEGGERGAGADAVHAPADALGNNTESAATCDCDPSISNDFNNLQNPITRLSNGSIFDLLGSQRESLDIEGTPPDTLPAGCRESPTPCTPAQRRASFFSRKT